MLRRTALALPLAFAAGRTLPWRLSVRVEPLFPGLPLLAQIEKVAEAGFPGFEFGDWRAADAKLINPRKQKLGLECACIVGNRGVNPPEIGRASCRERV